MKSTKFRSGGATMAAIIALAAIVGIGVIWYFASDVFRTKADRAIDQMTTWTPENIAKDPVNYLNFCETKTKEAQTQLKADRIKVEQTRGKLNGMKEESAAKIAAGEKALKELMDLYRKADDAKTFPVTWQGQPRDQDWMKTQIVSLNKQVESQKGILNKVTAGLTKLDTQVAKITKADSEASAQLIEIATNRQLLDVNKLTDDLKVRLVNMKGTLQGVVASAGDTASGALSLDDLTASAAASTDTAEFDKIMSKGK